MCARSYPQRTGTTTVSRQTRLTLTAGPVPVCQADDTEYLRYGAPPFMTTARIYNPAKTAMQSGTAGTKSWVLEFEQASPKAVEPLMGWTSSSDTRQQVRLRFDSKKEAIAYCEQNGIAYRVFDPNPPKRRVMAYADNFAYSRRTPWTH
jgi:ETC complex I subunit conserved region